MVSVAVFLLCAVLLVRFTQGADTKCRSGDPSLYCVPSFRLEELEDASRLVELREILGQTGLVSLSGSLSDKEELSGIRQAAFSGLCACAASGSDLFAEVRGADTSVLKDGATRRTLATATVGNVPRELDQSALKQAGCTSETIQAMEALRDQVAWFSHSFVTALDRILDRQELLETDQGIVFSTLESIVKASQNLEHFHVYEQHVESPHRQDSVLDVHTDAGLFLAFIPGMHCSGDFSSSDFYVQHNGEMKLAVFEHGSVGIMLGIGAENWLKSSVKLRATRHAVQMESGQTRAWYGMSKYDFEGSQRSNVVSVRFLVHLVPQDAIIHDFPKRTFADMRKSMVLTSRKTYMDSESPEVEVDSASIGCGLSEPLLPSSSSARITRRRLQMVEDASVCNNATNFFCWMSCLDIPQADKAHDFIDDGYSLYCLDPATLARPGNSVSAAVNKCTLNGVVGGTHNDACLGSWQKTAEGVHSQEVVTDKETPANLADAFCYGGTSMYMDGFHWTDTTCVIYLFPDWIIQSAGSLVGACIGTLFFGFVLEGVIKQRRNTVAKMPKGWRRLGVTTLFYGGQLTLGYMLMLVVMTYSGPLFLCVVLGLMGGHFCFNADSARSQQASRADDEGDEEDSLPECCRPHNDKRTAHGSDDSSGPCVPEGSTPCCQNTL